MKQLHAYLTKKSKTPVKKKHITLHIGARPSPLAQIQVDEVVEELQRHHPNLVFSLERVSIPTRGDIDRETSLKNLDKTSFFTEEIDVALLTGQIRLGVHSAKDLPDPLPSGLKLICLTKGIDPSDSLVLRERTSLADLPIGSRIGTSSFRREQAVLRLRPDCVITDIRGTIGARLELLHQGTIDGLVVAEAALIRLQLTHLNRLFLPGCYTPLQGQLAVVARANDPDMERLFASMDTQLHG